MLMGPVFRAELLRTARQRRYYVLRLAYGLVLLLLVWTGYEQMRWGQPVVSLADVAAFASSTFAAFAMVQLVALLLVVPPIFGGAVADEKQRKTLHYLMASQLTSVEIILDKLLGRSAHLAVFAAIGLPVVCLLGLFGGISAESVLVAYVGTFSTVAFAVAMTILVSTLARRVRDAILSAYLMVLTWLFVPPLVWIFGSAVRPALYFWIEPVNDWVADTSPVGVALKYAFPRGPLLGPGRAGASMEEPFLWMVEAQLAGAVFLLLLAMWRLRPTFRRQEETPARRSWFRRGADRRRPRRAAHSECGDDPILWKERYFAPVDRFTRLVLLPAIVFVTLPLVLMVAVEGDLGRALGAFWRLGWEARQQLPERLNWSLQVTLGWYVGLWLLAVAGASASSITIEREKDTWVSLTATPLTGREILRGKVFGALRNQAGFAAVLIFVWALALLTGASHPLGVLVSVAVTAFLTWFVAVLGVHASLRASNTSRAMATTLGILACGNGYPLILLLWFLGGIGWNDSYSLLGAMPTLSAGLMASPAAVHQTWINLESPDFPPEVPAMFITLVLGGLFICVGTTLALRRRILDELDHWLHRRPASPMPAADGLYRDPIPDGWADPVGDAGASIGASLPAEEAPLEMNS